MPSSLPSSLPGGEWRYAFATVGKIITYAAREAKARNPSLFAGVKYGVNLPRWAVLSYVLPRLSAALKEHPGIETPEQVKQFIVEFLSRVDPREAAREFLAKKPKYAQIVDEETLAKMIEAVLQAVPTVAAPAAIAA